MQHQINIADRRGSSSKRGYDRQWYDWLHGCFLRGSDLDVRTTPGALALAARYRCAVCGSRRNLEYDHIRPLREGGARLDAKNVQPLCRRCHAAKTALEQRSASPMARELDAAPLTF